MFLLQDEDVLRTEFMAQLRIPAAELLSEEPINGWFELSTSRQVDAGEEQEASGGSEVKVMRHRGKQNGRRGQKKRQGTSISESRATVTAAAAGAAPVGASTGDKEKGKGESLAGLPMSVRSQADDGRVREGREIASGMRGVGEEGSHGVGVSQAGTGSKPYAPGQEGEGRIEVAEEHASVSRRPYQPVVGWEEEERTGGVGDERNGKRSNWLGRFFGRCCSARTVTSASHCFHSCVDPCTSRGASRRHASAGGEAEEDQAAADREGEGESVPIPASPSRQQKKHYRSHRPPQVGERHLGLDHPELRQVAARVGVLGAERGAKSVDVAERARGGLGLQQVGGGWEGDGNGGEVEALHGVASAYFPMRKGCRVTLYQDSHIWGRFTPRIEMEGGVLYEPQRGWEDMCR